MSFQPYEAPACPGRPAQNQSNAVARVTTGLTALYNEIGNMQIPDESGWSSSSDYSAIRIDFCFVDCLTKEDGSLDLDRPRFPLLGARYQLVRLIGTGTFSQMLLAVDTFSVDKRKVAIKVMNVQYKCIGLGVSPSCFPSTQTRQKII